MDTKEATKRAGLEANVAWLRLMQSYDPDESKIYLIVEGNDDVCFYRQMCNRHHLNDSEILPAGNRDAVTATYDKAVERDYSSRRVWFFIDRDFSEITGQYTPDAPNVYVTDEYSIENSIFNKRLFIDTLEAHYQVQMMTGSEIAALSALYDKAETTHENILFPVMCWIVQCRLEGKRPYLDDLHTEEFYSVHAGAVRQNGRYKKHADFAARLQSVCGAAVAAPDLSAAEAAIAAHGGIHKCLRGKSLLPFFVSMLRAVTEHLGALLPGREAATAHVAISKSNVLEILCGLTIPPESLERFFEANLAS